LWNLQRLAQSLSPFISADALNAALGDYQHALLTVLLALAQHPEGTGVVTPFTLHQAEQSIKQCVIAAGLPTTGRGCAMNRSTIANASSGCRASTRRWCYAARSINSSRSGDAALCCSLWLSIRKVRV
jgi:hypothetical protein